MRRILFTVLFGAFSLLFIINLVRFAGGFDDLSFESVLKEFQSISFKFNITLENIDYWLGLIESLNASELLEIPIIGFIAYGLAYAVYSICLVGSVIVGVIADVFVNLAQLFYVFRVLFLM